MRKLIEISSAGLTILLLITALSTNSCNSGKEEQKAMKSQVDSTFEIYLTSEAGDKIARMNNVSFKND